MRQGLLFPTSEQFALDYLTIAQVHIRACLFFSSPNTIISSDMTGISVPGPRSYVDFRPRFFFF